jgi:PAS domain S-box-containing protein
VSVWAAPESKVSGRLDAVFFERLFQGAGLAVFACDTSGRVRAWNTIGELLLRATGCWHEGTEIDEVLPEPDRASFRECFRTCLTTRQPTEMRTRIGASEHDSTDYAVWITPIMPDQGRALDGVSVWFHDITARVQLRRSLRKHERLTSLGAMSGAVAHHYNNLLCGIATSLEYALNLNTTAAIRRALQRTAEAVTRATHLTRQLLAFAQGDHQAREEADVTATVLEYLKENETRLQQQSVSLRVEHQAIPPLKTPREHLTIVLGNLIENALDAMPGGGTLTVGLLPHDEHSARLFVRDSGAGIQPEQMERLFEPFFTTKGEMSSGAGRRAGMGLAVAYGLVSEMHGKITASNVPEGGAQFDVFLPYPGGDSRVEPCPKL